MLAARRDIIIAVKFVIETKVNRNENILRYALSDKFFQK